MLESIVTTGGKTFLGSGTLLAWCGKQYVLTAAHVVEDENGNPVAEAQVQFYLPALGLAGATGIGVTKILGRRDLEPFGLGDRDLALLKLQTRIDSDAIVGAVLPTTDVPASPQVLVAGYGQTNGSQGGYLTLGFGQIDAVGQSVSGSIEGHPTVGPYLVNRFQPGEAAFAEGDSGGPDFLLERKQVGRVYWLPVVVGVHSFWRDTNRNDLTDHGEDTYSVQLTPDLTAKLEAAIGTYRISAHFDLHVSNDGDFDFPPPFHDDGEWKMWLIVNGTAVMDGYRKDFSDEASNGHNTYRDVAQVWLSGPGLYDVKFYGRELDGGLKGKDDTIAEIDPEVIVPYWISERDLLYNLGSRGGDTAYDLFMRVHIEWVLNS